MYCSVNTRRQWRGTAEQDEALQGPIGGLLNVTILIEITQMRKVARNSLCMYAMTTHQSMEQCVTHKGSKLCISLVF